MPLRLTTALVFGLLVALPAAGQTSQGSRNVELISHSPLRDAGPALAVAFEQEGVSAFVAHAGAISVLNTETGRLTSRWTGDGVGIRDISLAGRQTLAVAHGAGVSLMTFDDSGSLSPGSEHSIGETRAVFGYQHSTAGAIALAATAQGVVLMSTQGQPIGIAAAPEGVADREKGMVGVSAAYDLATETDRLYAAGAGGYFVFDITVPAEPALLTWVNSAAVHMGVGVQPSPDATHIVTTTNYASAPVRIFDLRPALDGTISQVRTASGAWTADWHGYSERFEVRWPYVFVAARDQGFQMFNMNNTFEPYTTAWFKSSNGTPGKGAIGAVDLDVRNRDGLVAVADAQTGVWLLRVEDFTGWDGRGWGLGNISSVQDWESGPVGSDKW
ncbi:MAG: hypothetical protein ACI80V_003123 [Rhodothermales bacterium]|jgi:hypothetical protein